MRKQIFQLSDLILPVLPVWLLAWGLGIATALSVIGLLVVSGYFLTMAGLVATVGGVFNYMAISGLIRNLAITRTLGRYGDLMVSHSVIFEILKRLRIKFFNQFAKLPAYERQVIGTATAQYRLVKDIDTLNDFAIRVISPFVVVSVVLLGTSLVLGYHVSKVFLLLLSPLLIVPVFMANAKKNVKKSMELQERRQTYLINYLPVLTQLTLWNKWQTAVDEIGDLDKEINQIHTKNFYHNMVLTFGVQIILIVVLMMVFVTTKTLSIEKIGSFLPLVLAVVFGFFGLMEIVGGLTVDVSSYAKSVLAKERLNAILRPETTKTWLPIPNDFSIKIHHLSAYQPKAIFGLDEVNVEIKQGVPLVISGVSGGGKSTLLQVLAGELLPKAGKITICTDDNNVLMADIDWQGELGFLGQQVDIFDQSLALNLRLGKVTATDDELWQVLDLVGLKDWAEGQPNGLDTNLGEYGTAVSGGQARRIALARLLLSPKKVLLLDEPFAGLDSNTRERLWTTLKTWQKDGILVVVSHHQLGGTYESLVVSR